MADLKVTYAAAQAAAKIVEVREYAKQLREIVEAEVEAEGRAKAGRAGTRAHYHPAGQTQMFAANSTTASI